MLEQQGIKNYMSYVILSLMHWLQCRIDVIDLLHSMFADVAYNGLNS